MPKGCFVFFGSTIGNFEREDANFFLKELSSSMYPGDQLLIGFDMLKDINVLHRAYNDSKGVTAAFNLNILNSIGRIVQSDIPTELFEHKALYNPDKSRIEMYLEAKEHVHFHSACMPGELIINKGGKHSYREFPQIFNGGYPYVCKYCRITGQ